jgi:hypothetical protein
VADEVKPAFPDLFRAPGPDDPFARLRARGLGSFDVLREGGAPAGPPGGDEGTPPAGDPE